MSQGRRPDEQSRGLWPTRPDPDLLHLRHQRPGHCRVTGFQSPLTFGRGRQSEPPRHRPVYPRPGARAQADVCERFEHHLRDQFALRVAEDGHTAEVREPAVAYYESDHPHNRDRRDPGQGPENGVKEGTTNTAKPRTVHTDPRHGGAVAHLEARERLPTLALAETAPKKCADGRTEIVEEPRPSESSGWRAA
jgi:hypothetical protein